MYEDEYRQLVEIYPFNLIDDLAKADPDFQVTPDVCSYETIIAVLEELTEKEQKVLEYRYKEKQTQKNIGNAMGISMSRVQQLEQRAKRKLCNIYRQQKMSCVPQSEFNQIKKEYGILKEHFATICKSLTPNEIETFEKEKIFSQPIETLNLTTRTYNSLRRGMPSHKRNYCIGDLKGTTLAEIKEIRNLGKYCFSELNKKLNDIGIETQTVDGDIPFIKEH